MLVKIFKAPRPVAAGLGTGPAGCGRQRQRADVQMGRCEWQDPFHRPAAAGRAKPAPTQEWRRCTALAAELPYGLAKAVRDNPVTLFTTVAAPLRHGTQPLAKSRHSLYRENRQHAGDQDKLKQAGGDGSLPMLMVGRNKLVGFQAVTWGTALTQAQYPAKQMLPANYQYPGASGRLPAAEGRASASQAVRRREEAADTPKDAAQSRVATRRLASSSELAMTRVDFHTNIATRSATPAAWHARLTARAASWCCWPGCGPGRRAECRLCGPWATPISCRMMAGDALAPHSPIIVTDRMDAEFPHYDMLVNLTRRTPARHGALPARVRNHFHRRGRRRGWAPATSPTSSRPSPHPLRRRPDMTQNQRSTTAFPY